MKRAFYEIYFLLATINADVRFFRAINAMYSLQEKVTFFQARKKSEHIAFGALVAAAAWCSSCADIDKNIRRNFLELFFLLLFFPRH